jgi:hypothetical protein
MNLGADLRTSGRCSVASSVMLATKPYRSRKQMYSARSLQHRKRQNEPSAVQETAGIGIN